MFSSARIRTIRFILPLLFLFCGASMVTQAWNPLGIVVTQITETSITITWSPKPGAIFKLITSDLEIGNGPRDDRIIEVSGSSHTVSDLKPGTLYALNLNRKTRDSSYTQTITARTESEPIETTATPSPARAALLAKIEAKIIEHRDVTGRADLVAAFIAARDGLTGLIPPDEALAKIKRWWKNDLWSRIRKALKKMKR